MLIEIKSCEVCGGTDLVSALDLGNHPMCDDLVEIGNSRICKEYPIEILYCGTCRTAHQRFQIPKKELFPSSYHYRARHTADVISGMRELVSSCETAFGSVKGKKILDIGCNDGSLLSIFKEKGAITFGIEPTGAFEDAIQSGHTVINDFFTPEVAESFITANGQPDIITFTNVFAHIEDLKSVIRGLNVLRHDNTVIVIENHYFGAVLERFQFDTFYHEHPRTYSYTSFAHIGDSLGMSISHVEFPQRYNGNIRVFYSPQTGQQHAGWQQYHTAEENFGEGLRKMGEQLTLWKQLKRQEIETAVKEHGPIRAKAFPGRAAIPLKLLFLDNDLIKEIYEKPLSAKIGHFAPGSRIPIVSDDIFDSKDTSPILNLAWHIGGEIEKYMRSKGYTGKIIDIITSGDAK